MATMTTAMPDTGGGSNREIKLEWPDIVVIVVYFAIVMAFGIWSSCKNRGSVGGYFLAGRDMHFALVGASLFASNIGSEHFIGLAGSGAASGIGIAVFELNAIFILMILGWIFVPVYISSGVFTMPEYLRRRFGGQRIRVYLAVLALLLSIFTKVSANMFAGAVFIEQSLGLNVYVSVVIILAIAALFTIAGGLTAVIWTDFIQTIIMLFGAFYLMIASFAKIGGITNLKLLFMNAIPESHRNETGALLQCVRPPNASFHLIQGLNDPMPWPGAIFGVTISATWYLCCDQVQKNCDQGFIKVGGFESLKEQYMRAIPVKHLNDTGAAMQCSHPTDLAFNFIRPVDDILPWPGMTFGITVAGIWYWCSDQVIVQRTLAAKNWSHAKAGCILAGWLKILPMWLIVLPGMISRVLWPNDVGCADPDECMRVCGSEAGCTNIAYPLMVLNLLPVAARGLMVAVMLSAIMSSLTSIFNSSSTIFTVDVWCRMRKNPGTVELMIVGRLFVLVMVAVGIAWIPIIKSFAELFHYVQSVTSYLAPPICAVYCLAVLWKRTNEQGAFWGLMVGLAVGLTRFIWENVYKKFGCGHEEESNMPDVIAKVHYLHFGIILCAITAIVTVIVSLATKPIPDEYLARLTFWDRYNEEQRMDISLVEAEAEAEKKAAKNGGEINPAYTGSQADIADSTGVSIVPDDEDVPWYKVCCQWMCGIEKQPEDTRTEEEKREMEVQQTSLAEVPFQRKACNIMAVILMTVAVFLWGFFA